MSRSKQSTSRNLISAPLERTDISYKLKIWSHNLLNDYADFTQIPVEQLIHKEVKRCVDEYEEFYNLLLHGAKRLPSSSRETLNSFIVLNHIFDHQTLIRAYQHYSDKAAKTVRSFRLPGLAVRVPVLIEDESLINNAARVCRLSAWRVLNHVIIRSFTTNVKSYIDARLFRNSNLTRPLDESIVIAKTFREMYAIILSQIFAIETSKFNWQELDLEPSHVIAQADLSTIDFSSILSTSSARVESVLMMILLNL